MVVWPLVLTTTTAFMTAAMGTTRDIGIDPTEPPVFGLSVTPQTRCSHWASPLDIIAIKHACCQKFYACISCHDACEDHKSAVWPRSQRSEQAILCGECKHVLAIHEYMRCRSTCTHCGSGFNPRCKGHWGLYFEVSDDEIR